MKIKILKNLLLLLIMAFPYVSCSAQIIPVEEHINYKNNEIEVSEGTYYKDVNHLFDKYVGTWLGKYDNKTYEFFVTEYLYESTIRDLKIDELQIRYIITDNSTGEVLVDTTSPLTESYLVISGMYMTESVDIYALHYLGLDSDCGQNGTVHIAIQAGNANLMRLTLYPDGEVSLDCEGGSVYQILPTGEGILLTKQ